MGGRPFYRRVAIGGFVLLPASYLAVLIVVRLSGDTPPSGAVASLLIGGLVFTAVAALLFWTNRFLIPALILGAVVAVATYAGRPIGGLRMEGFFDFTLTVASLIGSLAAVIGCAASLVQRRHGTLRGPRPLERLLAWSAVAGFVAVCTTSWAITYTRRTSFDAPPGSIVVEMHNTTFKPSVLHMKSGQRVRVFAVNEDPFAHTFTIDALGVDEYVGPRAGRLVEFIIPADKTGRHVLTCSVTGHGDMRGKVIVER